MKSRFALSSLFLLWLSVVLTLFFVVQKPAAASIAGGLAALLGTILMAGVFVGAGAGLGYFVLSRFDFGPETSRRLIFSAGLGMGLLGLLGFGAAVIPFVRGWIPPLLLLGILGWSAWKGYLSSAFFRDACLLWNDLTESARSAPAWIRWFALAEILFVFLLSLAPPVEAFDGLFYHLTVPFLWLRDGGIQPVNMPHYWYPALMEGMFLWPMSVGLDSTPQLIHAVFGVLSVLLVWDWTRSLFGGRAAFWSIAVFLTMPSLPWLASWAYTDLGLIFYSLASLLAFSKWYSSSNVWWLLLSGSMTGFGLGIKYTSFVLPLVILAFLGWRERRNMTGLSASLLRFAGAAILTGFPWYLRNWIWTGNPIYPFLFGGLNWDSFRAEWYAGEGSGVGLRVSELLALPFVTTLGYRDVNYFDGRFGPFFLVLFPVVLFTAWRKWGEQPAFPILFAFSSVNILVWTYGVVQTAHLMQARLLWPGLFPLVPFMAGGILELESLNAPKFKLGFIFSAVAGLTTLVFLLDFGLMIMLRNPVMAAVGSIPRRVYTSQVQPGYAQALELVEETSPDAYVYLLNEPRSYGMSRRVQPDPINDNLAHDFHLYPTNGEVLSAWREAGYTHVLMSRLVLSPDTRASKTMGEEYFARLNDLVSGLIRVDESEEYILFAVPPAR